MSENDDTITVTLQVARSGDTFAVDGWPPRTRDVWAAAAELWANSPDREVARAMVRYIDSLLENHPKNYGFLGTLDVNGEEYDVSREQHGVWGGTTELERRRLRRELLASREVAA